MINDRWTPTPLALVAFTATLAALGPAALRAAPAAQAAPQASEAPAEAPAPRSDPPLVIAGVDIVDVRNGALLEERTVVVADGRIRSVVPASEAGPPPDGANVVDGTGRVLIPGLWDMHAHLRHPIAPTGIMPQLIAHGVTGVREMASGCDGPPDQHPEDAICLAEMLEWRTAIEGGELLGPRLLSLSSFPLNPPWDFEATEEMAGELVGMLDEQGADLLKVYFRMSPETFRLIADEAERRDLRVAGHLPMRMTSAEASAAGLRSIEHARDLLFDCFPGSAAFRRESRSQNPPTDAMRAMVEEHDPAICDATFATLIENDTWYVPTHVTRRMDAYADDPEFRNDPRRKYIPAEAWDEWQEDADNMVALDSTPEGRHVMRSFYEKGLEITGRAHDAGVGVLLGTDAGDTYVFFGSGAHDELAELVKAGLTPAEALAAATVRPAEFLGREDEFGTVEAGRHADLVLLGANPLDDIAHTREIEAVVYRGRLYDRAELDRMLESAAETVAAMGGGD
jgi:imidazolonepropionase-like amidohydrolase